MTRYVAAYNVESPRCLAACRKIVQVHRRRAMPATFFLVGRLLEAKADEWRRLLDDPLFEVASHSWSHRTVRDHPFGGTAARLPRITEEIVRGKAVVEEVFERPCLGLRPAGGFPDGLRGAPAVLEVVRDAGLKYLSSQLWGPDFSLPAPLAQAFPYARDGFPDLWELPGHGWHEDRLKAPQALRPKRLTLWPPVMPEAVPPAPVETPRQEADVHRLFLEKAAADGLAYVSLIWRPWSLDRFDPAMEMPDLVLARAADLGLKPATYGEVYRSLAGAG